MIETLITVAVLTALKPVVESICGDRDSETNADDSSSSRTVECDGFASDRGSDGSSESSSGGERQTTLGEYGF